MFSFDKRGPQKMLGPLSFFFLMCLSKYLYFDDRANLKLFLAAGIYVRRSKKKIEHIFLPETTQKIGLVNSLNIYIDS